MKKHLRMIDGKSLQKRIPAMLHGRELGQQIINNILNLIVTVELTITTTLNVCTPLLLLFAFNPSILSMFFIFFFSSFILWTIWDRFASM